MSSFGGAEACLNDAPGRAVTCSTSPTTTTSGACRCTTTARLFEMLVLEGAQAGLSWITILRKREDYRRAFDGFDPDAGRAATTPRSRALLADPGIVRNRLKIEARSPTPGRSSRADETGSFDAYVWQFVGGAPKQNAWQTMREVPAEHRRVGRHEQGAPKRGFTFVGSTICYAFMQAAGMVNDHLVSCFRHKQIRRKHLHV